VVNDIVAAKVALNHPCARWRTFFIICVIFQNDPKNIIRMRKKMVGEKSHRLASEKTDEHKLMRRKKRMSENR